MNKQHSCRCRDCLHLMLGYTSTTQENPTYVCALREKRIYRGDYNGVRGRKYYFVTKPHHTCKNFKPKGEKEDGNKEMH